jgi:hypothetical protein
MQFNINNINLENLTSELVNNLKNNDDKDNIYILMLTLQNKI